MDERDNTNMCCRSHQNNLKKKYPRDVAGPQFLSQNLQTQKTRGTQITIDSRSCQKGQSSCFSDSRLKESPQNKCQHIASNDRGSNVPQSSEQPSFYCQKQQSMENSHVDNIVSDKLIELNLSHNFPFFCDI